MTFVCSHCEEPQEYFTYRPSKRGWAKCPNCGKHSRTSLIPKELIKEVPEAYKFQEEPEGVYTLRPPHVLMEEILTHFGVKERAKDFIINYCKRAGGMPPSKLKRALISLDTGLNREKVNYITEEYFYLLQTEEEKVAEYGRFYPRFYPMRKDEPGYGDVRYPWRGRPAVSRYDWGYDRSLYGRPWERSYPIRERTLTRDNLMDILLALLKCLS